ncbi:MAG TPA: hypothetical protein VFN53_14055 [Acidobacteriaceae bacterium]|nr:hypothetical protein [Acidobacteriaceae bacterium]
MDEGNTDRLDRGSGDSLPNSRTWLGKAVREERTFQEHVREGRFQRSLVVLAAFSSLMTGLEVGYQHYRGSYSRRVMYTPVALSGGLFAAGIAAVASKRATKWLLRPVAALTLADGAVGFYFHVRGIARKPGGWRFPMTNMVMGPPVFAPLLFGLSAYLGLIATWLRREESDTFPDGSFKLIPRPAHSNHWMTVLPFEKVSKPEKITWRQDIREGRFQRHMAAATALATFFSGFEAFYSHYKNNFQYTAQWTPVLLAPMLVAASLLAMRRPRVAHTWLPLLSAAAVVDGSVGFFYHSRGVLRRPGGRKHLLYNIMYGPPVLAPLLFSACGMLGLLASAFRREQ